MKKEVLSSLLTRALLALLPAWSALALLVWSCGAELRASDAALLLAFSVLLALSAMLHPVGGPLGLAALTAAFAAYFSDRTALLAFFRALLSGNPSDGNRVGLLLCAAAVGLLCLFLLRSFWPRAVVSVLFAAFWVYAAFRLPQISKLAFAAAAPILFFTLCEAISRCRGVEEKTLEESGARLLLFCVLALLLLAAPSSKEPYPYPVYNAVRSRIVLLFERVETRLLYRNTGSSEFSMRFDGYAEQAEPGGEVEAEDARMILIQPGPDTGGVFYLAGSSYDDFDGRRWTSTVDRELVDTLGWSLDVAERLYACWRVRQSADSPLYVGENSLYLHYRNMDVRTLFTTQNTYFIRSDADRYPFRSQPSKVLFDYQQDREAWYRLFLIHPYASEQTLIEASEGYDYDETASLQWNTVLLDFDNKFGVDVDRADKVEPLLARRESFIRRHYLALPEVSNELRALAQRITAGCETDSEKLAAIKSYLQTHYSYTRSPSPVPEGETLLDYLLFGSKEGYCTWYATAAAVLGRLSGVPTRYVQGYRIELEKGQPDLIGSSDSHAWCEGYVAGFGWVTVDATPGFRAELPTDGNASAPAHIDVSGPSHLTIPGVAQTPSPSPEPEEADEQERAPFDRRLLLIPAALLLLFLLAAALTLLRRKRRAERAYAAADFRDRIVRDVDTLLGYLARRGYVREENQSLREFFSKVRWHYLLDEPERADKMLRLYEDVLFGEKTPTEQEWIEQRQFVNLLRPRRKK